MTYGTSEAMEEDRGLLLQLDNKYFNSSRLSSQSEMVVFFHSLLQILDLQAIRTERAHVVESGFTLSVYAPLLYCLE
jgi:hypothetical protein